MTLRHATRALAAAALLLAGVSLARADDAAPPPARLPAPQATPDELTRWYGWQLLLADAAVLGTQAYALQHDHPGLWWLATSASLGAGPGLHRLHGQRGPAIRSAALRILLPGGFGLATGLLSRGRATEAGVMAGELLAMMADWPAREPVQLGPPAPGEAGPAVALGPVQPGDWSAGVSPRPGGAAVSLAIAF